MTDDAVLVAVPTEWGVTVTASGALRHLCPFKDEVDVGTATLTWTTGGDPDTDAGATVELHSLAAYLASWADVSISHEDLATAIWCDLDDLDGLTAARVEVAFTTAGLDVVVTRE